MWLSSLVVGCIIPPHKLEVPGSNLAGGYCLFIENVFFVMKFTPIYTYLTFALHLQLRGGSNHPEN